MKTETHKLLANYIVENYMNNQSLLRKLAFKIGTVEPDYNPFSYLRGFYAQPFYGHNSTNCRRYILKTARKLENQGCDSVLKFFILGCFIHYLADSFTYTHNKYFRGGVKKHDMYERELHGIYLETIRSFNGDVPLQLGAASADLPTLIKELHTRYEIVSGQPKTDMAYIMCITCLAVKRCIKQPDSFIRKTATDLSL